MSSRTNKVFHLSFGYEFETSELSFTNNFEKVPERIRKYRLDKRTTLYEDKLTANEHLMTKIESFQHKKLPHVYDLETSDYTLSIPSTIIQDENFFNDAEFVVTYSEIVPATTTEIMHLFYKQLRRACKQLSRAFQDFYPSTILNKDFPYRDIYKHLHHPYYLLCCDNDVELMDIDFTPQCTIGVEFEKAKDLLDVLYQLWYWETGEECPIYSRADEICSWILNEEDGKLLRDYLFLFAYSFLSRRHRKKRRVFLFRNLFSELWKEYLKQEEVYTLNERFKKYFINHPEKNNLIRFYKYFLQVHDLTQRLTSPMKLQYLTQTTLIDEEGRFFIEYRGLSQLLSSYMEEDYFTIHSFLADKKIKRLFCG